MTNRHFQTYRWEKHIIAYNSDINQATEKMKKRKLHRNWQRIFFFQKERAEKKTVANETAPAWCWIEVQICMLSKSKVEKKHIVAFNKPPGLYQKKIKDGKSSEFLIREKKKRKNVVSFINEKAKKSRNTRKKWIKWVLNRENETNSQIVHKKYVGKRFETPRGMVQNI